MKIPVVEPGKGPCVREIAHGLKAMQRVVDGLIQAVYPFQDSAACVSRGGKVAEAASEPSPAN